ncbi:very long chain fatty acid elongase 7-like [Epargyreus clarus]|uniref:very long chain fatty acid elongase 7-like n=1 Tax=Epargyreus clarus TaxID=520877 RepID=UPI003C2D8C05
MAEIVNRIWKRYTFIFEDLTDPRTNTWFLVARPYQGMAILALYLMFVLKWGPRWMKNRPAYNINKVLIVHNIFQVIASAWTFCAGVWYGWGWDYKWICEPVDFSSSQKAIMVAKVTYAYYLIKYMDLMDTVFFVLRKKTNQVSFLHVYHHTSMVMLSWGSITYLPGGHASLIGVINSFVHVVMYTYYLLSVITPSVKNSVGWKKHITQLQIIQLLWCCIHISILIFKSECAYPRWVSFLILPGDVFMLSLFVDFYFRAYIRRPKVQSNGVKKD